MRKLGVVWFLVFIILIGLVVYGSTLSYTFVWDDENLIVDDPSIKDFRHIPDFFSMPFGYSTEGERVLAPTYRPLQSVSFSIDYFLWGLAPFGYHLTNVFLHIAVGLLLFALLFQITGAAPLSFFTSAMYLVHPVNIAGVAYISGRSEPLAAVFFLSAFLTYIAAQNKKTTAPLLWYAVSALFYIGGILSKEVVLVTPALFLLYNVCFNERHGYKGILPYIMVAAVYVTLRLTILKFTSFTTVEEVPPLRLRLIVCPNIVLRYLRLLFFPFGLHLDHLIKKPDSFWQPEYCIPALILIPLVWFIITRGRKRKLVFFGFLWFMIMLFPFLNILFQLNAPLAEHWLYFPAMGFFIGFVALIIGRGNRAKKTTSIICSVLIVYFSVVTINAHQVWKNNEAFFKNIIAYNPYSFRAHLSLGVVYRRKGEYRKAIASFKEALALDPDSEKARYHLEAAQQELRHVGGHGE